jgi:hypothetical protein
MMRFELTTARLRIECSTTELHRHSQTIITIATQNSSDRPLQLDLAGVDNFGRAKIMRPADVCNALVTTTGTSFPI